MERLVKLKDDVKLVPKKPGVYFWLDKNREILYVGRATNLRSRLSQYLQKGIDSRISEMMDQAHSFKYIVSDTLLEAIILEAKEIKKHWPKYNVVDRDDRSFIYVVIPRAEFARPLIVRGQNLKKFPLGTAQVFGPYQSQTLITKALRLLRPIFPYSTCKVGSGKACFDYQIELCPGACIGAISAKDYQANIANLVMILKGEKKRLVARLKKENPSKARALQHLQDVSLLSRESDLKERRLSRLEGYDISHHAGKESYGAMVVFENGEPAKSEYRLFKIKSAPSGDDERALLEVLLRRFNHPEWPRPDLIMIDGGAPQMGFLSRELAKHNIAIPLVGVSQLGGDKLVFSAGTKKEARALAENIKPSLLKLREEAHRFANRGRLSASRIRPAKS